MCLILAVVGALALPRPLEATPIPAGRVLRIHVPEAFGGKTVIGQLTAAGATDPGHVTAYPCDEGLPISRDGRVTRSDLNYFGNISPVWSNRLIVEADDDGDVCFHTLTSVELVVDVNGVSFDSGITSFPNRRTDTRTGTPERLADGGTLRLHVPEAHGGHTVIGQLTVARATDPGHIIAYPCDHGRPQSGRTDRSDLNYFGNISPIWSNRLIVQADDDGDICFFALTSVDLVIDINGVTATGIFSFPNRRTDTRKDDVEAEWVTPPVVGGVPVWPDYRPHPPDPTEAALTGRAATAAVRRRPIVAVKVDNYRLARPQWGLERADAFFEVEVEGISRLIALFHTDLPRAVGPVRSARTGDIELLIPMNRPVFAYSGSNPGVGAWLASAASSRLLVDFSAQSNGCYGRRSDRPGPHNLDVDLACAVSSAAEAGPARALWHTEASWTPPAGVRSRADTAFVVPMVGVEVGWAWDPSGRRYVRAQDGAPHLLDPDVPLRADTVVELRTKYIPSPVDARSPHVLATGSGHAVVHRDGRAFPVMWSRPTAYDPFRFTTDDGFEVPVDVGVTFVELIDG